MMVFIVALSMFFAAGIVIYLLMRQMHQPWPPRGFPALPASLWLSTLDIVFSSITIQGAVLAARRGDKAGLQRNLVATLVLGPGVPRPAILRLVQDLDASGRGRRAVQHLPRRCSTP